VQHTGRRGLRGSLDLDTTPPRFDHRRAVLTPPLPIDDSSPLLRQSERELMHFFGGERPGDVSTCVDTSTSPPPTQLIERPHNPFIGRTDGPLNWTSAVGRARIDAELRVALRRDRRVR